MINKGMSEQDLIDLVQSQLPQDLTEAQIEQLRKTMRTSPELRDVLLEELRLEQGLSSRLAPEAMETEEFIRKIEDAVAFRKRSRFLWSIVFIVCGIGMIAGAVGVAFSLREDPIEVVTNKDADAKDEAKDNAKDGAIAKDSTRLVTDGKGDKPLKPDGKGDGKKQGDGKADVVVPPRPVKPFAPPWKLYDDPASRGDFRWLGNAKKIFKPLGNASLREDERNGLIEIGGQFNLPVPTEDGETLRFRISDIQSFKMELSNGEQGVRIRRSPRDHNRLLASVIRYRPEGERAHGFPAGMQPEFDRKEMVERVDKTIDFDWNSAKPAPSIPRENLAVRWSGAIKIPKDGKYTFTLRSDDGASMSIDGHNVVTSWSPRAVADSLGSIELEAGMHDIDVRFFQSSSAAEMHFYWESKGIKRQIVPASALRTSKKSDAKPGLLGQYVFGAPIDGKDSGLADHFIASMDLGTWQSLRNGMLDLRYQDGHVVLARGNVPLLVAPMRNAPTKVIGDLRCRIRYAETVRLKPIALHLETPSGVEAVAASKLDWRVEPITLTADAEQRKRYEAEIAKLEEKLKADSPQLRRAMTAWEKSLDSPWQVLEIRTVQTSGGSIAKVLPDHSVLLEGDNPKQDVYQMTVRVRMDKITGIRLDVLPDPSLPKGGPGRGDGNFIVTGFHVQKATMAKPADIESVAIDAPSASSSQSGYAVQRMVDGKDDTGWAIRPQIGKPSSAVLPLKEAIEGTGADAGETILHITISQKSKHEGLNIGRFRLSVTDAENPNLNGTVFSESLAAILRTPAGERTPEQSKRLLEIYRTDAAMLEPIRKRIDEVKRTLEQHHPVIAKLAHHDDGSVELIRVDEKRADNVSALLDMQVTPPTQSDFANGGATVVTMEVMDASHGTAVFACRATANQHRSIVGFAERAGKIVACLYPHDDNYVRQNAERGFLLGDGCFLRFTYQAERVVMEFSRDNRHWVWLGSSIYDERQSVLDATTMGVEFWRRQPGQRNIRIKNVKVEHLNALEKLADPEIVKRVPKLKIVDPKKLVDANKQYSELLEVRPRKYTDSQWRRAVAVVVLNGNSVVANRRRAVVELIEATAKDGNDPALFIAALRELPRRATFSGEAHRGHTWHNMFKQVDAFAQRLWNTKQRDALGDLLDAWYTLDMGFDGLHYYPKDTAPTSLIRMLTYHRMNQGDWRSLRLVAMQNTFMNTRSSGEVVSDRYTHQLSSLLDWASQSAAAKLDDGPDEIEIMGRHVAQRKPVRWSPHPLVVESNRETLNAVAEFIASVDAGAYAYACETLTKQALPDGIAPVDPESQLFKSTHVLVRDMIDRDEKLAATLKSKYEKIGLIRLQQALRDGRFEDVVSIATQFHGTEAAWQALRYLGERELSMGNFFAAAGRFNALLDRTTGFDEATRADLFAKRRLALAMAGEKAGDPVTTDVQLGNELMSPKIFERLISTLVEERRSGRVAHGSGHNIHVDAPAPRELALSKIRDLSLPKDLSDHDRMREIGWTIADGKLVMHQHGRLMAISLSDRKTLWQIEHRARNVPSYVGAPATPFVHDGNVFAPIFNDRKYELICASFDKGQVKWRQQYDQHILGDPVVIGPWLYMLTMQEQLGDYADVILHRIAPESGESVLSQRVLRVRFGESLFRVGKLTLVGDALIFRVGNSLVCSDLLGSPRWIRKLSFVPPKADAPLFDFQNVDEFVIDGENLIATCPGSPHIICVNIKTGEQVWTRMQPRLRKLVGLAGGNVIVSSVRFLEAFDAQTGELTWMMPHEGDYNAVLIAQRDRVLTVGLDKMSTDRKVRDPNLFRSVRWIDGKAGTVVRRVELQGHEGELYDVEQLISNGQMIVGLSNVNKKSKPYGRLIILQAP